MRWTSLDKRNSTRRIREREVCPWGLNGGFKTADNGGEWLIDVRGPALTREWEDIDPIITHKCVYVCVRACVCL